MKLKLLFVLVLMLLVAVFSVQNAGVITVSFLRWHFAISEALVILLAAFFGALGGLIVGAVAGRRRPEKPPPPGPDG
jgi:uncharacterized integral membrane protein